MGAKRAKSFWKGNGNDFLYCRGFNLFFFLPYFFPQQVSEVNVGLKATANHVPQHWQPNSGLLMTNDVSGVNLEEAVPCIALSKNDSYVMSAAGGKVSLFNMMTFKVYLHIVCSQFF